MNAALYKQRIKNDWRTLAVFGSVVSMYVSIMVFMYDPEFSKALDEFSRIFPQMMAAFGMSSVATDLTGFLASYLYGFILLIFPMVYIIITANSLMVRHVDRGSMAYLLASPNKRTRIAFTQAMSLISGIFILVAYAALLAVGVSAAVFPGEMDVVNYLVMNAGVFCLHFFIGGLCFFASCVSNDTGKSTLRGGGTAIVSYLFQSLANAGDKFENLKYATFFTLFDAEALLEGSVNGYIMAGSLLAGGVVLFAVAIISFGRRDLHV